MRKSDFILVKRYSKAFLSDDLNESQKRLDELMVLRKKLSALEKYLLNPAIAVAVKKELFAGALAKYSKTYAFRFVELLLKHRRFELLDRIIDGVGKLIKDLMGIQIARLTTAGDLDDYHLKVFKDFVKELTRKTPEVHHSKNPAILGGFQIKIDDDFIDASVLARLNKLKEFLHS